MQHALANAPREQQAAAMQRIGAQRKRQRQRQQEAAAQDDEVPADLRAAAAAPVEEGGWPPIPANVQLFNGAGATWGGLVLSVDCCCGGLLVVYEQLLCTGAFLRQLLPIAVCFCS